MCFWVGWWVAAWRSGALLGASTVAGSVEIVELLYIEERVSLVMVMWLVFRIPSICAGDCCLFPVQCAACNYLAVLVPLHSPSQCV